MGPIGPKCPFSLFIGIVFGVFAKTFLKTVQTFKMGHSLKLPVKKKKISAVRHIVTNFTFTGR